MISATAKKLEALEERVRRLADDRAVGMVKQLHALSRRGTVSDEVFDDYMAELERAIEADLRHFSDEDRLLVRELFGILRTVVGSLRPKRIRAIIRNLVVGKPREVVDDFGRDELFLRRIQPLADFLFYRYFRVEVEGLENVPVSGPCLLIANHAGMLPFDAWMVQHAVQELHPSGRPVRFLIEEWFTKLPFMSYILTRMGMLRGSQSNAERLIALGEVVGVFPEGVKGIGKPFRQRYHLQRFGRGGTIRLAMRTGAPIVPVAVLGAEETYPILFTSGFLANALRVPYFPFTPTFPLLGPFGVIPLPSKWHIRFGAPMALGDFSPGSWEDDILVNTQNELIRNAIQAMVSELVQERRGLFFG